MQFVQAFQSINQIYLVIGSVEFLKLDQLRERWQIINLIAVNIEANESI